ncbi:MAG: helix-turn-helix transcriptional regulator [Saprospiraceae bacterium]|nr:helix-turn-helix transcriptional regulator [Saprospiraceae bacterium]
MMRFNYLMPSKPLQDIVEYYLIIESQKSDERFPTEVFPTMQLEMAFTFGSPDSTLIRRGQQGLEKAPDYSLDGFSATKNTYINQNDLGVIMVGFKPRGLQHFVDFNVYEMLNRSLDLKDVRPKEIRRIEDQIRTKRTDEERIKVIEDFLLLITRRKEKDLLIENAVFQIIGSKGKISVKELAAQNYLGQKQFTRRFIRTIGSPPKFYLRLVRFQNILTLSKGSDSRLTEVALESGFFDQAHFIKEFKQFTDEKPTSLHDHSLQTELGRFFEENFKKSIFYNSTYR